MQDFSLLDNLPMPVLALEKDGRIAYANHACVTFFRAPPRVLKKAQKVGELMHGADPFLKQALSQGQMINSAEMEVHLPHAGKGQVAIVVLSYLPDRGLLAVKDMTVEGRLHAKYREKMMELRENHAQITQADKLSTLGELTAGISHEINNPLTIAVGNVEVMQLLMPDKVPPTLKEALENVKESLDRINQIVVNMRQFLHKSEDKREYCDLGEVARGALKLTAATFEETGIKVDTQLTTIPTIGLANRIKLEQAIINLLKNAMDALKEQARDGKDAQVRLALVKDAQEGMVEIRVQDNGPGIPETDRQNVFSPFFTTKEVGEGTGLGLSIARKIVEAHQGTLLLSEAPGGGCLFTIRLPSIEASSYTQNERYLHGISATEEKKILVVDDAPELLNVLDKFLEETPYVFVGSANAHDALEVLERYPIDLVITDYNMPGMNGREFVQAMRDKGIMVPALYMTSPNQVERFNEDQVKLDVRGLLLKPFSKEEVLKAVRGILGGEGHGAK